MITRLLECHSLQSELTVVKVQIRTNKPIAREGVNSYK